MKKSYWLLCGIALIWFCGAISKTIDNNNTTAVSFVKLSKGSIDYSETAESVLTANEKIRVRSKVDLIIEDVYISKGDHIEMGDKIASVYEKSLTTAINNCVDQDILTYLTKIRDNENVITATTAGYVFDVFITGDSRICTDDTIYKYIPDDDISYYAQFVIETSMADHFTAGDIVKYTYQTNQNDNTHTYTGEATIINIADNIITCSFPPTAYFRVGDRITVNFEHRSEVYDYIVPYNVLHELTNSNQSRTYSIYYAIPQPDEDNRYTVVESKTKVFETNGVYAAIEYRYSDERYIIQNSTDTIVHLDTVRESY